MYLVPMLTSIVLDCSSIERYFVQFSRTRNPAINLQPEWFWLYSTSTCKYVCIYKLNNFKSNIFFLKQAKCKRYKKLILHVTASLVTDFYGKTVFYSRSSASSSTSFLLQLQGFITASQIENLSAFCLMMNISIFAFCCSRDSSANSTSADRFFVTLQNLC